MFQSKSCCLLSLVSAVRRRAADTVKGHYLRHGVPARLMGQSPQLTETSEVKYDSPLRKSFYTLSCHLSYKSARVTSLQLGVC